MKHERISAAEPIDLFDVEPTMGGVADPKPRDATAGEIMAYGRWLMQSRGLRELGDVKAHTIGDRWSGSYRLIGFTFGEEIARAAADVPAQYEEGAYSIPVPGGRGRETVTMERLGEAGEVLATSIMPTDAKRAVVWKKEAVAAAVGPIVKPKRSPKPKPAMSDRDAIALYCETRRAEIEAEHRAAAKAVAAFARAIGGFPATPPAAVAEPDAAPDYTISEARYSHGNMLVRCPSGTGYKSRAARLIGDGLKCRWVGRGGGYVASPAKVAKFEALYAAGFDANPISGEIDNRERGLQHLTAREAMRALTATPAAETREEPEATAEPAALPCAPTAPASLLAGVLAVQADMRARLAALEARLAPQSAPENEISAAEVEMAALPVDPRARAVGKLAVPSTPHRSPARERLLRRYLAMRAERTEAAEADRRALREREKRRAAVMRSGQWREKYLAAQLRASGWEMRAGQAEARMYADEKRRRAVAHIVKLRQRRAIDRMALHAAGESVREAQDEVRRIKVETAAKPMHQNEPAPDLVAQVHREREAAAAKLSTHIERADRIERANDVLIREVQALSSRAHRAEAALRLREVTALPHFAHVGSPSARVSFQLPVRVAQ